MSDHIEPDTSDELTIDALAGAAGLMVSTVRLYQNRGLLPPPTRRGRIGYYDRNHLRRLRLIARLQERGFSLAGIKELLDGMDQGQSLRAVLGLGETSSTWTPEPPEEISLTELAGLLPQVEFTPEVVRRNVELGLVELADDGTGVVIRSPSFLRIGRELAALGVPPDVILDQYEALRDDTARIAGRFTDVFRTHLWEPFVAADLPEDRIPEVIDALERLGSLAEEVVGVSLRHALQELAETFIRGEAERLGVDIPRPGGEPTRRRGTDRSRSPDD